MHGREEREGGLEREGPGDEVSDHLRGDWALGHRKLLKVLESWKKLSKAGFGEHSRCNGMQGKPKGGDGAHEESDTAAER